MRTMNENDHVIGLGDDSATSPSANGQSWLNTYLQDVIGVPAPVTTLPELQQQEAEDAMRIDPSWPWIGGETACNPAALRSTAKTMEEELLPRIQGALNDIRARCGVPAAAAGTWDVPAGYGSAALVRAPAAAAQSIESLMARLRSVVDTIVESAKAAERGDLQARDAVLRASHSA
jgi:hypothetical protein